MNKLRTFQLTEAYMGSTRLGPGQLSHTSVPSDEGTGLADGGDFAFSLRKVPRPEY